MALEIENKIRALKGMKNKTVSLDAKPAPAVEAEAAKADKPTKKAEAKDPVLRCV